MKDFGFGFLGGSIFCLGYAAALGTLQGFMFAGLMAVCGILAMTHSLRKRP